MEREGYHHHERTPRTEPAPSPADRQRALLDRLEAAVGAIHDSDTFRAYLDAQARFHRYSPNNVALILTQCPDATQIAGYRTWQALGRQVRRGESAIKIIVPMARRRREADDHDQGPHHDTDEPVRLRFGVGNVFDISQTEGEALPAVDVPTLEGDDGGLLYDDLARMAHSEDIRIDRSDQLPSPTAMGFYHPPTRRIVVREAAQLQMTKTLAHELAHHFTGLPETYDARREEHETVAESVAYVVLAHFGLDSGERSFPYIATWAQDPAVLRGALSTIQRVASIIIDRVERQADITAALDDAETGP